MAVITVKELQALGAADNGQRISMGNSLYGTVRAGSDGVVSVYVVWRYRVAGKKREIPVGTWKDKGGLSLQALRAKRDALAVEHKEGVDPIERNATKKLKIEADAVEAHELQLDRIEVLAEKQARLTVRALFDFWSGIELKNRCDGGFEARRAFERDVFPLIGDLAVADVKKAHIQSVVDTMMQRDVVRMTKRVLSDLRQMFGFALDRDYVEADPTARIKKAKIGPDGERDRVLSEAELMVFLKKIATAGMAETSQCALLLQMATITRIGETLAARWEHVDFERRQWVLPDTKNGKAHTIWLSDFALRQFERLRDITGMTEWVFPNSKLNGPLDPKTVTKQVADRQREPGGQLVGRTKLIDALMLAGGQWRPHDLRRTGASEMATLGALPDVIEKCLNHTEENKMKRIYQRAQYEGPMREAWKLWGDRLDLLSNKPNNVLVLRAA
ncbi:MAG: tyrosine-type recombinase/integrase [Rhodoferax sp.]|uniref:tyrosine-type recombinase/integrase n=1 Tax=Rhodoferax sp. TaxID=50421 RepID=UPI0017CCAC37|nr:site-specific integrase [Rhodoferax sp.]NMM19131.1 tyrosine-type recombinase/integrase [Rhodoferax sp.]